MTIELSDIVKDLEFEPFEVEGWAVFQPEIAKKDGIEYHRKKGSDVIYKQKEEGFECLKCGSEIITSQVAHSIWDGPFSMSGSGKCHYEHVPYCPKCEERPKYSGSPITVK